MVDLVELDLKVLLRFLGLVQYLLLVVVMEVSLNQALEALADLVVVVQKAVLVEQRQTIRDLHNKVILEELDLLDQLDLLLMVLAVVVDLVEQVEMEQVVLVVLVVWEHKLLQHLEIQHLNHLQLAVV
jgi:hypothetical protein